jgi:hypothetical protein
MTGPPDILEEEDWEIDDSLLETEAPAKNVVFCKDSDKPSKDEPTTITYRRLTSEDIRRYLGLQQIDNYARMNKPETYVDQSVAFLSSLRHS